MERLNFKKDKLLKLIDVVKMKKILAIGLIVLLMATFVTAKVQSVETLENKRDKVDIRIDKLEVRIEKLQKLISNLQQNLEKLKAKAQKYEMQIQELNTCNVLAEDIYVVGNGNLSLIGEYLGDCGAEYIIEATTSATRVSDTRIQVAKVRFSDTGGDTWSSDFYCSGTNALSNGLSIYCNGGSKIMKGDIWAFTIN